MFKKNNNLNYTQQVKKYKIKHIELSAERQKHSKKERDNPIASPVRYRSGHGFTKL